MNPSDHQPRSSRARRVRLIRGRFSNHAPDEEKPVRRGVYLLPITITSLGLLAGFYSLISSINLHFEVAAVMIAIAFVCDGLDGRVARASRTASQFGVEYDSLSDVVAFGVAPAGLMYNWALRPIGPAAWLITGIFVVCAALRLARFNVQVGSNDKKRFVGIPVPGAAAAIAGWVLAYSYFEFDFSRLLAVLAVPATIALASLMISRVPYPSFKGISLRQRAPIEIVVVVLVLLGLVISLPQIMAFLASTAYLLSGPFLMLRGEGLINKVPVLGTAKASQNEGAKSTGSLAS